VRGPVAGADADHLRGTFPNPWRRSLAPDPNADMWGGRLCRRRPPTRNRPGSPNPNNNAVSDVGARRCVAAGKPLQSFQFARALPPPHPELDQEAGGSSRRSRAQRGPSLRLHKIPPPPTRDVIACPQVVGRRLNVPLVRGRVVQPSCRSCSESVSSFRARPARRSLAWPRGRDRGRPPPPVENARVSLFPRPSGRWRHKAVPAVVSA